MLKMLRQPPLGRYGRFILAALLLAGLAMVAVIWLEYSSSKKPLQDLGTVPWVPGALTSEAPHYSLSFYGPNSTPIGRPLGVAVSGSGRVYVTESEGKHATQIFDSSGKNIGMLAPPSTNEFNRQPVYLAISPDGRIFVSDRNRAVIDIYSSDGKYTGTFQPKSVAKEDWHPMGVAFDGKGNVYVTDLTDGKHRVLVFDQSGELALQFGSQGSEAGQFWFPNGVAVDAKGRIYVADGNNGRVEVFDGKGKLLSTIERGFGPGNLAMPRGLAIDDQNRLFVVDTSSQDVKIYDVSKDGAPRFLADFGGFGQADGQFQFPNGVAVDGHDKTFVTDREGGRVEVFSY